MELYCELTKPVLATFFSTQYAPDLLFYAYIPIIVVSMFFSIFVLINDKFSVRSKLLFGISTLFSIWILNIFFQWMANYAVVVNFSWAMTAVIELPLYIFVCWFVYVYIFNEEIKAKGLLIVFSPFLPILFLLPTTFNLLNFDLINCEAVNGLLWKYIYAIELVYILLLPVMIFVRIKNYKKDKIQTILVGVASTLLLTIFWVSNIWGEITRTYEINLIGPIGMVLFIGLLTFLIVQFKAFNVKLVGAQALVWASVILIGSQFFYLTDSSITVKILTAVTLIITSVLGYFLVGSVKKEDALNEQLAIANAGQTNLIHIMNHQIKGYLSISKNIFAELLTDDYGKVPEEARGLISQGLENADKGTKYVTAVLKGESAENGKLVFDMKLFDLKKLVTEVVAKEKEVAEKKGLKFTFDVDVDGGDYNIMGDIAHLGEAVRNLIDNSINYTPTGSISITLCIKGNCALFKVKDTGVGVKEEDKSKLFKAGGVGSDSIKINTNSSGYGLAFVKGVIENHKGRVWFESEGAGKGSTFYIELPVK